MLAQGDSDLYSNILEFILQMVPFAKLRTQLYFNHSGIFFIETKTLFGAYMAANYGTYFSDRTEKSVPYQYTLNSYLRYDFGGDGGTTEVANMVLDLFEHTNNITQLKRYMPLLMETLIFYDSHYEKTSDPITGKEKMYIFPTQALETYWCAWKNSSDLNNGTWVPPNQSNCVKNDHPTVVSLHVLAERSFRLLRNVSRDIWTPSLEALLLKLQQTLPDIPTIVENGTERTSPYENYPIDDELHNSETPELYGVHPFRYYTQGRQLLSNINISPAIQCLTNSTRATCTKNAMNNNGWTQGIMNAALLGLNNLTKNMLIQRVQTAPAIGYRFEAFAPHEQDYEPSADHYANMITAYQWMLLQPADDENGSIILFGAWPCEWDVEFKLHGPQNTIVEGVIKDGQVISLHVEPEERAKHVYNMLYC
jgi:alpha-L-fucosidase 2